MRRINNKEKLCSCAELIAYIEEIGFLPLLHLGVDGWSAQDVVSEECWYVKYPDGGWEWPLWKWKGEIIRETGCAYGKFLLGKAAFISKAWWPDFCNYRRSLYPAPEADTIEGMILQTLRDNGSLITKNLRRECGFDGPKMRGKFDTIVSKLEKGCYIVTEDFVYPHDRHGKEYGWGWALLTTPEQWLGIEACRPERTPEESYRRLAQYWEKLFPDAGEEGLKSLLR